MITFKPNKLAYYPLWSLFADGSDKTKPEQIVDRYFNEIGGKFFPKISESKINRQLKAIASQAGIEKNVTFHMGRHTFGIHSAYIRDDISLKDPFGHITTAYAAL